MRLQEFWGVGPKTSERLETALGVDAAVDAIESGDIAALVEAGISRGRATRILRRANGGEGMAVLGTRDARAVYKELLDVASEYAVTETAADRMRLLTPFLTREDALDRLDAVMEAADSWAALDADARQSVLDAFWKHAVGGERAAVRTALALQATGVSAGAFAPVADIDADDLRAAADALADLHDGSVADGADDELDALRAAKREVERLEGEGLDVLAALRGQARASDEFEAAFVDYVAAETDVDYGRIRDATPDDAADASDFVSRALRALAADLRVAADERETTVAERLRERIEASRPAIDAATDAVSDLAFHLSLARFAEAFDLTRPEFVDDGIAVLDAENVFLRAADGDRDGDAVQPVSYAVGDHDLDAGTDAPPSGDRVTVLTGANSGGKTTLLETLCQVALLAQMGLPVPAAAAQVSVSDSVVFHRRHASFNAGVLESTLRSIVPPLTDDGRTLMLVDEFEAITEPGSAADLLHGLVGLTGDRQALGVFVTHLAEDLKPLPADARKDGIFAEGLDDDLELRVDYQPRFDTVGKSTPEFIVSRLLAGTDDAAVRGGFETLARAVGEQAVQRTLGEWSPDEN